MSPLPTASVGGATVLGAVSRGVEEPAFTSRTPRRPGLARTARARARWPGLAERGFPVGAPRGPAGKEERQGTALYAQSRRALPGVLMPGIARYAQPRWALSKELRQGTDCSVYPAQEGAAQGGETEDSPVSPTQTAMGRPDLAVGFSPVIEAGGERLGKA